MYRGKNRLRRALLELREDLGLSNWMQLWRAADVASNYSHWDKLVRSKTTLSFKKEMIEEFIKGFEREGHPLTPEQQKRLHATIFGTDESIDRSDQLELLKNPDPHHLLDSLVDNFVRDTRQDEITEAIKRIKALRSRGGYLIITGQAGEGKTSLIVQLINGALGEKEVVYHIIPFTQGDGYQVTLLRSLMAALTLKYDYLSDLWMKIPDSNTLAIIFAQMLEDISAQGDQEVIFIDGLDQIEPDVLGRRNLSFLPVKLLKGIVIVVGTRPDDTLRLLELRSHCEIYELPHLCKEDFNRILVHQRVQLDEDLINLFYEKMDRNVLYLDLVTKELAQGNAAKPENIIKRIKDNPGNIFSFSMDRLKRREIEWDKITSPILGLLLVAQESLTERSLQQILNVEGSRLKDGLQRLGGLVVKDVEGRYDLYHLKLGDYLRQDKDNPGKEYIFTDRDEEGYHERLANWCEKNGDLGLMDIWEPSEGIAEPEWRSYARQYYVTHLYRAKAWKRLWSVLDDVDYGRAKIKYDPSTRLYAQDIQLGRLAAARYDWGIKNGLAMLPKLWKYSLILHTLSGRADRYHEDAFAALVLLGQEQEAVGLTELLTRPAKKVNAQIRIAKLLRQRGRLPTDARGLLIRAGEIALSLEASKEKAQILREAAEALIEIGEKERAVRLLVEAKMEAQSRQFSDEKVWILCELAIALREASGKAQAKQWIAEAKKLTSAIGDITKRVNALGKVAGTLIVIDERAQAEAQLKAIFSQLPVDWSSQTFKEIEIAIKKLAEFIAKAQQWDEAVQMVRSMKDGGEKVNALRNIANTLAATGRKDQALELLTETVAVAQSIDRYFSDPDSADLPMYIIFTAFGAEKDEKEINTEAYITTLSEVAVEMDRLGAKDKSEELLMEVIAMLQHIKSLEVMADVTAALINTSNWKQAREIFAKIKDLIQSDTRPRDYGDIKFTVWGKLALALIKSGKKQDAERLLAEIKQWALSDSQDAKNIRVRTIEDFTVGLIYAKALSLMLAAIASAVAADWDAAENALSLLSTSDRDEKGTFLLDATQRVVEELAMKGEEDRAIRLVNAVKIISKIDKVKLLCTVAEKLVKLRRKKRASLMLVDAESIIRSIENFHYGEEVLYETIRLIGAAGEWERAESLARFAKKGNDKIVALSEFAIVLLRAGKRRKALRFLVEAKRLFQSLSSEWKDPAAIAVAKALTEFGLWDRALIYIQYISGEIRSARSDSLKAIAISLAKAKEWERFDAITTSIKGMSYNDGALLSLSVALAEVGEWERAEKLARSFEETDNKVVALSKIAISLAEAGQQEKAIKLLFETEDMTYSTRYKLYEGASVGSKALYELSVTFANLREWNKAEELAWSINNFQDRCLTLHQLAYTMVMLGEPIRALQLVQRTWLRTETRNFIIALLPMAVQLVFLEPQVSWELGKAVDWVDTFLKSL